MATFTLEEAREAIKAANEKSRLAEISATTTLVDGIDHDKSLNFTDAVNKDLVVANTDISIEANTIRKDLSQQVSEQRHREIVAEFTRVLSATELLGNKKSVIKVAKLRSYLAIIVGGTDSLAKKNKSIKLASEGFKTFLINRSKEKKTTVTGIFRSATATQALILKKQRKADEKKAA